MPDVAMLSMFRDDSDRNLWHRLRHLTSKTGVSRWIWSTGNNSDDTEKQIRCFMDIHPEFNIRLICYDSDELGMTPNARMIRLSEAFNAALDCVDARDEFILTHESDLESPVDVAERFLATGKDVVGGWVLLGDWLYDTFCYRGLDHQMFVNGQKKPDEPIQMDSVGSCWLAPAWPFKNGVRCHKMGALDLMAQLRMRNLTVWCDPSITIVQPEALWVPSQHATHEIVTP